MLDRVLISLKFTPDTDHAPSYMKKYSNKSLAGQQSERRAARLSPLLIVRGKWGCHDSTKFIECDIIDGTGTMMMLI